MWACSGMGGALLASKNWACAIIQAIGFGGLALGSLLIFLVVRRVPARAMGWANEHGNQPLETGLEQLLQRIPHWGFPVACAVLLLLHPLWTVSDGGDCAQAKADAATLFTCLGGFLLLGQIAHAALSKRSGAEQAVEEYRARLLGAGWALEETRLGGIWQTACRRGGRQVMAVGQTQTEARRRAWARANGPESDADSARDG